MGDLYGANRHDVLCFPERLEDDSAADTPGRFLEAFGDALALAACGCHRAMPAATGRPGSAPCDRLQLDRYGDLHRRRSRRRLAQETHRTIAWLGLLTKLRPAPQTMADCRQTTLQPLRQVGRTGTRRCKTLDRGGAALSARAGRQFRAVTAQARHFTQERLTTLRAPMDARLQASLNALDASDAPEDQGTGGGAQPEARAATIAALKQRTRRDEGFQAQLLSRSPAQRSRTDPERRAMTRGQGRGTAVCDTVPTAVDATHKRLVAGEMTHAPGDRDGRSPLARQATEGRDCRGAVVADVGDDHGHAVKTCREAGLTPAVPRPITSAHEQLGRFSQEDVRSDKAPEPDHCPAGAWRTCRGDRVEPGRPSRADATPAGGGCALNQPYTRRQGGRRMTRWVEEPRWEEMAPRVRSRPEVMQPRQALVEPPCGTLKRGGDHGDVWMRGLEQVRAALSVTVVADKLRRVLTLVERPRLRAALG